MPRDIVYFDLETQRTANDAGGWMRKGDMRMSVGVIFSTATGRYEVFGEAQVNQLIERLRRADLVIGFNVLNFDYHVLMGYTILDLDRGTADGRFDGRHGEAVGPSARARCDCPGDPRHPENGGRTRRDPLVARRAFARDRGVLLLRREGDTARA